MAMLGETLFEVTEEEVEMWEMRGKAREGNWSKTLQAGVGSVCPRHIQPMVAAQLACSGRLELGGHMGREGEGERRYSMRENDAPKKDWDWVSAAETGCSPPSGRSAEINPLSPPLLLSPPSSLPGPPRCHQEAQQAQGGS